MAVTVEEFANYVGEDYETSSRQADLVNSLSAASTLLDLRLLDAFRQPATAVLDQMVKDVALAIYRRSENGNGQYDTPETLRAPNNPLASVESILRYYVMGV